MISKKNLLMLFMLTAVSPAQAQWEPNLLFGVSGGLIRDNGVYNTDITYTGRPELSEVYFTDSDPDHGLIGGIFAGIQARKCRWLLGAELHINWNDMDHHRFFVMPDYPDSPRVRVLSAQAWSFDGTIKNGRDYGILGRVGYEITSYFLPYMFIGGGNKSRHYECDYFWCTRCVSKKCCTT